MISLSSPCKTRAHDWPAGAKLAGLSLATFGLFFVGDLGIQSAALLATLALYALPGRVFLMAGLSRLRALWPFLIVVGLWHAVEGSYVSGAVIGIRMITAVALANLVTMTTRLADMIDVVRFLAAPLRAVGVQTRALELSIALVIRMTPVLLEKARGLSYSWRARSHRRPGWRIVLPFTLQVLDDADQVSAAIRARGGLISTEND